jgi:hypothetical protein
LDFGLFLARLSQCIHYNKTPHSHSEEDKNMGRMRENPRYNVISMRISDEERDTLQEIMQHSHKSVSDIMREAMALLKTQLVPEQRKAA